MCGIAGIFHYGEPGRPIDRDLLTRMTRIVAHRGPDGEGFHIDGPIGLGHRRLSIVDLSPTGAQPMHTIAGNGSIIYNGEFYNQSEFRPRLEAKGVRFRGASDTETLLYLMAEEGPDALENAAGIYAFAFWNRDQQKLTLARDPLGVKQLYFHDNGRRIVFASEIKALLACPEVPREVDPEAVSQYLHFHTALFERTFYSGIQQVRAGEYIEWTRHGARARRYWSLNDFSKSKLAIPRQIEALRDALSGVVRSQLMSDVPVAAFFSGGIDSSAIASFASSANGPIQCFGVHFTDQGVADERPYQEAAAKALGVKLELTTIDGGTFPDDLRKLMYYQDAPVIGAAMFPMYYVSKLAAGAVKVCLGGQAADELFGGYARYALANPWMVARSWFRARLGRSGQSGVSGNLSKQLSEKKNLRRLLENAGSLLNWQSRYFDVFTKVSAPEWSELFADPEFVSRERCRQVFTETLNASAATDPGDKLLHWDMQTYLTGLFHQDDRMSMAVSLESRVPFADPRIVKFAATLPFDVKFRNSSSKWILRQAVADMLPAEVLNRRKVGFDTPVERWIGLHKDFVRDLLLSRASVERGWWNRTGLERLLDNAASRHRIDKLWKTLCIETWAQTFLDSAPPRDPYPYMPGSLSRARKASPPSSDRPAEMPGLSSLLQEVRELGAGGTLARAHWEMKIATGIVRRLDERGRAGAKAIPEQDLQRTQISAWESPAMVRTALQTILDSADSARLLQTAVAAGKGNISCFGRWIANYGNPIDWARNPFNGYRWPKHLHWSQAIAEGSTHGGDIKLTWEAARFPQAFLIARAATVHPDASGVLLGALCNQIECFIKENPPGLGIHWGSGQEIAIRLLAWGFGLSAASQWNPPPAEFWNNLTTHALACGRHIRRHLEYAQRCVDNNHLLSEALGLLVAAAFVPQASDAAEWRSTGRTILSEQCERQFYPDGCYINQSNNYARTALQTVMAAAALERRCGRNTPDEWTRAIARGLDFLAAQQNPLDGWLPNYGSNDGSMPAVLSTREFPDFRPTLQAASVMVRGERLYEPSPCDEEALWFEGPTAVTTPLRPPRRVSVSFAHSGHHILRATAVPENFAVFRCGSLRDRFSQIDMLHLDIWWKGHNVLTDPGTYLYGGPPTWHEHFLRTGSHNTIRLDARDQMLHLRRFKVVYWTEARLLRFVEHGGWAVVQGEHYGYRRYTGNCIHRRTVFRVKDAIWVVVDRVLGSGVHALRLHWLGGDFRYAAGRPNEMTLHTPSGEFVASVWTESGVPASCQVLAGSVNPPAGWLSRYYAGKAAVPALITEANIPLPAMFVSVLAPAYPKISVDDGVWTIEAGDERFTIGMDDLQRPVLESDAYEWVR